MKYLWITYQFISFGNSYKVILTWRDVKIFFQDNDIFRFGINVESSRQCGFIMLRNSCIPHTNRCMLQNQKWDESETGKTLKDAILNVKTQGGRSNPCLWLHSKLWLLVTPLSPLSQGRLKKDILNRSGNNVNCLPTRTAWIVGYWRLRLLHHSYFLA